MGRNAVRRTAPAGENEAGSEVEETEEGAQGGEEGDAPMPGGSLGVSPPPGGKPLFPIDSTGGHAGAQPNKENAVTRPQSMVTEDVRQEQPAGAAKVRRFEVINGGRVMWQNFAYQMKQGQIVTDHTHDIRMLKNQGIRLHELKDEE